PSSSLARTGQWRRGSVSSRSCGGGTGPTTPAPPTRSSGRSITPSPQEPPMAGDTLDQAKTKVTDGVDRLADDLEKISHQIHATPELCFHEEQAAGWLSAFLERQGARVERGVGGLPPAFPATIEGSGPGPTIAIMAEYDALPNIGHACGHNVIATAGTGAGAAIAAAFGTLPFPGRVQVIGTPAEEGGAGKVRLLGAGIFEDADPPMMIHG